MVNFSNSNTSSCVLLVGKYSSSNSIKVCKFSDLKKKKKLSFSFFGDYFLSQLLTFHYIVFVEFSLYFLN